MMPAPGNDRSRLNEPSAVSSLPAVSRAGAAALDRRAFLRTAATVAGAFTGAVAGALLPCPPARAAELYGSPTRSLWLYNANTRETGTTVFWHDGGWDEGALAALDWHFRDWRLGRMIALDRRVYEALWVVQRMFPSPWPLVVASGYRAPETNARLAEKIPGVARNSFHLHGQAVDFWVPERSLEEVWSYLNAWNFGGLGLYRRWIHLDVGPRGRRWNGS